MKGVGRVRERKNEIKLPLRGLVLVHFDVDVTRGYR